MKTVYHCDCHNYEFDSKEECKAHEDKTNKLKITTEKVLSELKCAADILEKYGIRSFSWSGDTLYLEIYQGDYLSFCLKLGLDDNYTCHRYDNKLLGRCFIESES